MRYVSKRGTVSSVIASTADSTVRVCTGSKFVSGAIAGTTTLGTVPISAGPAIFSCVAVPAVGAAVDMRSVRSPPRPRRPRRRLPPSRRSSASACGTEDMAGVEALATGSAWGCRGCFCRGCRCCSGARSCRRSSRRPSLRSSRVRVGCAPLGGPLRAVDCVRSPRRSSRRCRPCPRSSGAGFGSRRGSPRPRGSRLSRAGASRLSPFASVSVRR